MALWSKITQLRINFSSKERWRSWVYANDIDSAERGVPLERVDMQTSGVRNRLPAQIRETVVGQEGEGGETSTATNSTSGTLTPSDADEDLQIQASPSFKTSWRRFSERTLFTGATTEEVDPELQKEYDKIVPEKVEEITEGFPQLASFTASDEDFAICRGFKTLHWRLIQQLEVEITVLEKELRELDERDIKDPDQREHRLRWTLHEEDWNTEQKVLMKTINEKLKEYDDLVLRHASMQALGKPPARNHLSVFHWIMTHKPLWAGYYDFIYHADDFLTTTGNQMGYFEDFIQERLNRRPFSWIKNLLRSEIERAKTSDEQVTYYSAARLNMAARILLVSIAVGILLVPVYILFLIPMSRSMMALTATAFILPFSIIMTAVSGRTRIYEVFVGTATYGAVLVTFLGNISQSGHI